jgi:hypothetical protein
LDNCAPYDVIIDWNDILGIMDIETNDLIPLEDSTISAILNDIDKHCLKFVRKNWPKLKLLKRHISMGQVNTKIITFTYCTNTKQPSVPISMISALPPTTQEKTVSRLSPIN